MLNGKDILKINKTGLSGEDYYVLTRMYLPLIGTESFSVYLLLNNIREEETTVLRLLDLLVMNKVSRFDQSLRRLEGVGLLKRFSRKEKGYVLTCLPPLSGKDFLGNDILRRYLEIKIGSTETKQLREKSNRRKPPGSEDITLRFDEVYRPVCDLSPGENFPESETGNKETDIDPIRVENEDFDYIVFRMSFDGEIPDDVLESDEFRKKIIRISYLYRLNEREMKEAVLKAMLLNRDLRSEDVTRCAGYIYQNKNKRTADIETAFKTDQPEPYQSEEEDIREMIRLAENSSFSQLLETFGDGKASLSEVKQYEKLAEKTGLPDGVINLIILYVNKFKKGENIGYNYLEKIAVNWLKTGVRTTADAAKLLIERKADIKEKRTFKREAEEPEWMKRTDRKDPEPLSEEEMKEARKLAEKLLG